MEPYFNTFRNSLLERQTKSMKRVIIWALCFLTVGMLIAEIWEFSNRRTPLEAIRDRAGAGPFTPSEIVAMKYDNTLNAYVCFYKTAEEGRAVAIFVERHHMPHLVRLSGIFSPGNDTAEHYIGSFIQELNSCIVWGCLTDAGGISVELEGKRAVTISDAQELFWYIVLPQMPDHTLSVKLLP